jgi:molybdenum cofactor cytidylyltransferase
MPSVAIVPAAGKGERFGGAKLIARININGETLIDRTLRSLFGGGIERIVVVTAPEANLEGSALLSDSRVTVVVNEDPSRGMFSSIQCGIAAAKADVIVVLPADMPFVTPGTVSLVVRTCLETGRVVVPVFNDRRGHPVGIPGGLRDGLLMMPPDRSLKDALAALGEELLLIEVEDEGVVRDVDVKSDLN